MQVKNLVTIIMPYRDARKYLAECLESIHKQTYTEWELIAVNDHSKDNSKDILSDWSKSDPRVRLEENRGTGIIPALQTGFDKARGKYITRMDADDTMPLRKLELMVGSLESSDPKTVVTGKVKYFAQTEVSDGYRKYEHWLNERTELKDHWKWIYRECVIASPNWMAYYKDLKDINAFGDLSYPEDYDITFKWYQHEFNVVSIPETTLLWREHPERTSRNSAHYNQESFFELKLKHFISHELNNQALLLWGVERKGKLTAQLLKKWKIDFRWMARDAHNYSGGIQGIPIEDFDLDGVNEPFKLLIAVYPEGSQLQTLNNYLKSLQLDLGKDFWFL